MDRLRQIRFKLRALWRGGAAETEQERLFADIHVLPTGLAGPVAGGDD